jgi:hypothetical protein
MAARGARSRKILDKTIEKTDRKKEAKAAANGFRSASDAGDWEISSNARSEQSLKSWGKNKAHHARTNSRPSSASGQSAVSGMSQGKEKTKYQSKGKDTTAPRGRGGGVPIKQKTDTTERPSSRLERSASAAPSAAPSAIDTRPIPKKWAGMMMWSGNGQRPQPYRGFEHVRKAT